MRAPKVLACAAALLLAACGGAEVREEFYPDGAKKSVTFYRRGPDSAFYRHGVRYTWYPGGARESMATYEGGYLEGYSMHWYRNGRLNILAHYREGRRDGEARYWDEAGRLLACAASEGEACTGDPHAPEGFLAGGRP